LIEKKSEISELGTELSRISSSLTKEETNHAHTLKRLDEQIKIYENERMAHLETQKSLQQEINLRTQIEEELADERASHTRQVSMFNNLSNEMERVKKAESKYKTLASQVQTLADENLSLKKRLKDKYKETSDTNTLDGSYYWSNFFCLPLLPGI